MCALAVLGKAQIKLGGGKGLVSFKHHIEKFQNRNKPNLKPGEIIQVRSENEILATLDRTGALEGLAFNEEMRKYCGRNFRILKPVETIIVEGVAGRRHMKQTVILEGVMCDGEAHDKCCKTCPLLWKEAWLRRVETELEEISPRIPMAEADISYGLFEGSSNCQLINLLKASSPIQRWDFRQYLWDIKSGTYGLVERFEMILVSINSGFRKFLSRSPPPEVKPGTTPIAVLNLKPGELVEVKSEAEIRATLDLRNKNRGLSFTSEMKKHCGKRFRVLKRLDRMYLEQTGTMRQIANTVLLDGGTCDGKANLGCQRSCYCLYREIWLRRVK